MQCAIAMFKQMDRNNNGYISKKELGLVIQKQKSTMEDHGGRANQSFKSLEPQRRRPQAQSEPGPHHLDRVQPAGHPQPREERGEGHQSVWKPRLLSWKFCRCAPQAPGGRRRASGSGHKALRGS